MKITSRFTIAVHTMLAVHYFSGKYKTTSDFLAGSVNVNPVVIRRILGQLKDAGLITVYAGTGGACIERDLHKITLLDVYKAVDCVDDGLFNFHENPNPDCPVGKNIHFVLDTVLFDAEKVFENYLASITFADLSKKLQTKLAL